MHGYTCMGYGNLHMHASILILFRPTGEEKVHFGAITNHYCDSRRAAEIEPALL